jgi:hypothetical protein
MKKISFIAGVLLIFVSCAKKESKKYHDHPYLAQSSWPIIHHSPDQEASSPFEGPVLSGREQFRVEFLNNIQGPAPALFDSRGNLLVMGVNAFQKKHIFMKLDYETLEVKGSYEISIANPLEGLYSFVDNEDCWWNGYYQVISRLCFNGDEIYEDMHIDLKSSYPDKITADDSIVGIMPLYHSTGLIDIAFVTQGLKPVHEGGYYTKVTIGAKGGVLQINKDKTHQLFLKVFSDENITNNFAIDPDDGIYILTNKHAWKLKFDGNELNVIWSTPYEPGDPIPSFPCDDTTSDDLCALGAIQASVKFGDGSGTTPTLIGKNREYVAFADGARPMRIIVLRTADGSAVPVDEPVPIPDPQTQTENTISACGYKFAIESNYTKGLAGYEIVGDYGSESVKLKWRNTEIFSPNVVPLSSCASNTFYVYEVQGGDSWSGEAEWYVTALDLTSGELLWRQFIGKGLQYNSLYAPLSIDDKGRMYIGLFGGFMRLM